jgi:uncharacterized membrane protein YdjX (TVP38/TMEM64 family)
MPAAQRTGRMSPGRLAPFAVIVVIGIVVVAMGWHRQLSLETLVRHRAVLDDFVTAHYAMALAAFLAIYIAAVSLSIPGAVFLTISGGVLFGVMVGAAAAVVAATTGATVIFLVARSAFSQYVLRRAGPRLARIADGFCADAFSYLLFLRLVPVFPFFLVNLAPALVGVRVATFITATAIGVVPATLVFASVGAGLDSVIHAQAAMYQACVAAGGAGCRLDFNAAAALTPQLIGALVALGLLALIPVLVKRAFPRKAAGNPAAGGCEPRESA